MTEQTDNKPAEPKLVASNPGLVVEHLMKRYRRRPVLRDVSLNVRRGEAVGQQEGGRGRHFPTRYSNG